jgi:outer membrane protein TolC
LISTSFRQLLTLTLLLTLGSPVFGQLRTSPAPSLLATSPFLGGVPAGTPTTDTLALSIADAIHRALEHNLGVLMAEQSVERARGTRWTALSELLPNVSARTSEVRQKINLEAFGLSLPGFPPIIGPFNVFDARVLLSQAIVDLAGFNGARAEAHNLAAARHSYKSARDLVVLVTANVYLQTLAASSRAESARAQLETARALYNQAVDLKQGGLVAGIDVIRAEVRLSTERQRSTGTENEFQKSKLQLARVIGLPVGQQYALSDQIPYAPVPEMTLDDALNRAYKARPDYQAALERVLGAEAERQSRLGEALPSLHLNADYGTVGLTAAGALPTFSLAGAVSIPLFQGGRVHGRLMEADAELRDRRAEAEDLRAQIYYEVRTAFLDLQATREQLEVATRARELANLQLTQARDRFAAGVTSNIEVVQAQEAVALASEQYIEGLYGFNVSKAALARALGIAEEAVQKYLGGSN